MTKNLSGWYIVQRFNTFPFDKCYVKTAIVTRFIFLATARLGSLLAQLWLELWRSPALRSLFKSIGNFEQSRFRISFSKER